MATRREPLILVDGVDLVASGLWPDRHNMQVPLWERGDNVVFSSGKVVRRVPALLQTFPGVPASPVDLTRPIRGLAQHRAYDPVLQRFTNYIWTAFGGDIKFRRPGSVDTLVHTFPVGLYTAGGFDATYFDFTPWGNWVIVNSEHVGAWLYKPAEGHDVPPGTLILNEWGQPIVGWVEDTPASFTQLANAPTDGIIALKKRNQLLIIGHGAMRNLVSFSDADDLETWAAAPDNLAGEIPLEELEGGVKAAVHMGSAIAVFSPNQMFAITWIGAPYYYGQQRLLEGIGAVGKFAVYADGSTVYGVSRNGIWRTDGTTFSYLDEGAIHDYLQQNVFWAQQAKIQCCKNHVNGCIEFSFPVRGSLTCNEGWSFDPRIGSWSKIPAFEVMSSQVLYQQPLIGTNEGQIKLLSSDPNKLAELNLETKALLLQRNNQNLHVGALVDEIEIFAKRAENVNFSYGVSEYPDGPWSWTNPAEVLTNQITYRPRIYASGTYHKLRFTSYENNWDLDLQGFALFGQPDGLRRERL